MPVPGCSCSLQRMFRKCSFSGSYWVWGLGALSPAGCPARWASHTGSAAHRWLNFQGGASEAEALGASPPQVPGDPGSVRGPRPRRSSGWTPHGHPGPHATPRQKASLEKGRLNRLRASSRHSSAVQDTVRNSRITPRTGAMTTCARNNRRPTPMPRRVRRRDYPARITEQQSRKRLDSHHGRAGNKRNDRKNLGEEIGDINLHQGEILERKGMQQH